MDLGGYGLYIWPAYAATGIVLLALLVASLRALLRDERALRRLQQSARHAPAADPLLREDGRGDGG